MKYLYIIIPFLFINTLFSYEEVCETTHYPNATETTCTTYTKPKPVKTTKTITKTTRKRNPGLFDVLFGSCGTRTTYVDSYYDDYYYEYDDYGYHPITHREVIHHRPSYVNTHYRRHVPAYRESHYYSPRPAYSYEYSKCKPSGSCKSFSVSIN